MTAKDLQQYGSKEQRQLRAMKYGMSILAALLVSVLMVAIPLVNLSKEQDKLIKIQDDTITAMQERVDILNQTIDILELTNAITPEV